MVLRSMPRAAAARLLIGRLSQVIVAGSRGVDFDVERGGLGRAQAAQCPLRRRAAADIAPDRRIDPQEFFAAWRPTVLEETEKLEQLRALEHGMRIHVVALAEAPPAGVDTPQDLERVRAALRGASLAGPRG